MKSFHQFVNDVSILNARFTNSLRQCKPSFGVKIVLSGFTKDTQWRISIELVIFMPDHIEYAFVVVFVLDAKFMGGEY